MPERTWQLHEAKTNLSKLIDRAAQGEPQVITKRGKRTAVLISETDYERLSGRPRSTVSPDFVEHLLSAPKGDFPTPSRPKTKLRRFAAP